MSAAEAALLAPDKQQERNGPLQGTLHLACFGYLFPEILYTMKDCSFLQLELQAESKKTGSEAEPYLANWIPVSDGFISKWHSWGTHFQIYSEQPSLILTVLPSLSSVK